MRKAVPATVFVVMGEYATSENGIAAWIEGVARTAKGARQQALLAAEDHTSPDESQKVIVAGRPFGPAWDCSCVVKTALHGEDCDADETDWDVSYDWQEHDIR